MSDIDPFDPVTMAMRSLHKSNVIAAKEARIAELEAENARLKAENENAWGSARTYSRLWIEAKENKERLEAEVERLRASSFVTAVPVEQYERVIKAGSEMSAEMRFAWLERIRTNKEQREAWLKKVHQCLIDWEAAKEGKQP